jgi:hypothetical protein
MYEENLLKSTYVVSPQTCYYEQVHAETVTLFTMGWIIHG